MYEVKWSVSDAPDYYINAMLQNIVGLEISITHIQSKFKFDQNKSQINVEGICLKFVQRSWWRKRPRNGSPCKR